MWRPVVCHSLFHLPLLPRDRLGPAEAFRLRGDAGASVVGLNCMRGPETMLPLLREIRGAFSGHLAALPVPCRTDAAHPTFQSLEDPACTCIPGGRPFPIELDPFTCTIGRASRR